MRYLSQSKASRSTVQYNQVNLYHLSLLVPGEGRAVARVPSLHCLSTVFASNCRAGTIIRAYVCRNI